MKELRFNPEQNSAQTASRVILGRDLLQDFAQIYDLSKYSEIAVVTDDVVGPLWAGQLSAGIGRPARIVTMIGGEERKSIVTVEKVWSELLDAGLDRKSLVINLGGGVVTDLGGFAASTYMRGIDFVQVPSSLLAQVDASIGGKTGVNYAGSKNIIGVIRQPKAVLIDVALLQTLESSELSNGYAEMLKHGLIADLEYYRELSVEIEEIQPESWERLIEKSLLIKAGVVAKDPTEQHLRKILNFGHTAGHALEALSHQASQQSEGEVLLHGQAVGLGMLVELILSKQLGHVGDCDVDELESALLQAGLPVRWMRYDWVALQRLMLQDKKNVSGQINWTLLTKIGQATYDQAVPIESVKEAFDYIFED